jgi:hypothetical protein
MFIAALFTIAGVLFLKVSLQREKKERREWAVTSTKGLLSWAELIFWLNWQFLRSPNLL